MFPSDHPSLYYPRPKFLKFGDRMRIGVFTMVWPFPLNTKEHLKENTTLLLLREVREVEDITAKQGRGWEMNFLMEVECFIPHHEVPANR